MLFQVFQKIPLCRAFIGIHENKRKTVCIETKAHPFRRRLIHGSLLTEHFSFPALSASSSRHNSVWGAKKRKKIYAWNKGKLAVLKRKKSIALIQRNGFFFLDSMEQHVSTLHVGSTYTSEIMNECHEWMSIEISCVLPPVVEFTAGLPVLRHEWSRPSTQQKLLVF